MTDLTIEISFYPGEIYDGCELWAVDDQGNKVRAIPHDLRCRYCNSITWKKELGGNDRYWDGRYICGSCFKAKMKSWIGLISPRGCSEYNARFLLGAKAETLEHGKWYANDDLAQINGGNLLMPRDASQSQEKNIKKWRCNKTSEYL